MTHDQELPLRNPADQFLAALHAQPLTGSDIQIWCAPLSGSADELAYYRSLLSVDENARAQRFRFEVDQNRYIFGRGILRTLLGGYLGTNASQVTFVYGVYGKPAVESLPKNRTLQFNLAHSKSWALYAFTWDRPIGVDLEHVSPMSDADELAKRFFTPRETSWINSFPPDQQTEAFLKLWTCKEAFLKAHGSGLMTPLNHVEISVTKNDLARISSIEGNETQAMQWRLEISNPISEYQAAVAVEGHQGKIIFQSPPTKWIQTHPEIISG